MAWPNDRPGAYDEDKVWDEATEAWVANDGRQGGRHSNRIVVVGWENDGDRKVYFGAV